MVAHFVSVMNIMSFGFIFGSFTTGNEDKNFSVTPGLAYMRNEEEFKFAENLTLVLSSKNREIFL